MIKNINEIVALILKDADKRESDAGMGGYSHDGGASKLREQVNFYLIGLREGFPDCWLNYKEQFEKEIDPEYAQYLKLKKKFESPNGK